jgi:hypothetical protein
MNEEVIKWGKKQPKEGLTYDQIVFLLLKQTAKVVRDTSQTLENKPDADEQCELSKVEDELFYFFAFALDYWWQDSHTREQNRTFGEIFSAHLDILFGGDTQGRAMWDALHERFTAYGQIVNEQQSDSAKLLGLGMKLSEYCEIPITALVLTPHLFTLAQKLVYSVSPSEADKRRCK